MQTEMPYIPNNDFDITQWGVIGDGHTKNTKSIQSAIDEVSDSGGGRILFPEGNYLTGTIFLKTGVNIHLLEKAVLLGSTDRADYQLLDRWYSLLIASESEDIAVTGEGIIDGQGRELAVNINEDYHSGTFDDDKSFSYNPRRNRSNEKERPQIIEFTRCKRIEVSGVIIRNSANWVQTYWNCEQLSIKNLWVDSDSYWNNDGIDIENCKDVLIENCDVNTADDGICLKSPPGGCNEQIHIRNCRIRSSASAVKFGTDSHGGFKDILVENISVFDTFRSVIALESVDGGILENIEIRNITARNTGNAIFIRLGRRRLDLPHGSCRKILIKNVKAQIAFNRPDVGYDLRGPGNWFFHNPIPSSVTGIPGANVENVILENIEITYPGRANKGMGYIPVNRLDAVPENEHDYPEFNMFQELPSWGFYCRHVDGIEIRNMVLRLEEKDYRPALIFDDVKDLKIEELNLPRDTGRDQIVLRGASFEKENTYPRLSREVE